MTFESTNEAGRKAPGRGATSGVRFNNVGLLRLVFAASVMLSHSLLLLDPNGFRLLRMILNSEAAVQGFFILSGMLVFGSFSRIGRWGTFWQRRMARIYPGYLVAVLLFAALALLQARLLGNAVAWGELPRYLAANLSTLNFLQPTIGGVFSGNPEPAINGALWSIKVEIIFYLCVPALYWIGQRIGFGLLAAGLIVAGALWWPVLLWAGDQTGYTIPLSYKFQLPGQLHYFALGVGLFAVTQGSIGRGVLAGLVVLMLGLLVLADQPREAIQALVLVGVIGALTHLPAMGEPFGGRDLSYGIYLAHFPIVQLLICAGVAAALPVAVYVALVVVLATIYALGSWHLVEKPALSLGGRK